MGGATRLLDAFDRPTLAAKHWVLSIAELHAVGFTDDQIAHLAAIGLLHRIHQGVYAVGRPQLSLEGQCRAAWLACGPESAVSHISAAAADGYRRHHGKIHVSGPRTLVGHPKLIVHRPRSLPLDDIVERDGFKATSVARTLLDMSTGQSPQTIGGWMHEAQVQRVLDVREVWAVLQRHQHHRGRRRLEAALAVEVVPDRSGLERLYAGIVRDVMPKPVRNEFWWSGERPEEIDFCWPELNLMVEVDGGRYHGSRWRQRRDAAKDERFRSIGWKVRRFPELQIVMDPDGVRAETLRLATLGPSNPAHERIRPPNA